MLRELARLRRRGAEGSAGSGGGSAEARVGG
jgi:hypothetical protein